MRIPCSLLIIAVLAWCSSLSAATGDNAADNNVNLALLPSATLSGSVAPGTGRGAYNHILYNPATSSYAVQTEWNEYGVPYAQNLGRISEANAFRWQVAWPSAKTINRITIGGCYPNQPQVATRWKVQYRLGSTWSTLSEGQGGWLNNGIFVWGNAQQTPIVADAVRMLAYSDGSNDVISVHLRGRGGQSTNEDDRWQTTKATLIQYLVSDPTTPPPPPPPPPGTVRLLFDTDIGPDCDDAGTMAVLHAFIDMGEAHILGMAACVSSQWAAPCLDAMNTYYNRPNIPVGTLKEPGFLTGSIYSENVAKNFPNDLINGSNAPDAVALYRQILAAQPDHSVVFVAVGPLRNLRNLIRSGGDGSSPLSGRDLIAQKVIRLVSMSGRFPTGNEWNSDQDKPASKIVYDEWPTEIIFSGEAVGASIYTGHLLSSRTPASNPVRRAYELFVGANNSRSSWDQTAMYYAVRGGSDGLFSLSGPGTATITSDGYVNFVPSSSGRHRYMVKNVSDSQIAAVIEELMIRPPGVVAPPPPGGGSGTILREWWSNIAGTSVAQIPLATTPSGSAQLTSFATPVNWADNYGTRVSGWLHAPVSGTYRFWVAGDDNCELWLGSNDTQGSRSRIALVPGWTSSQEWNKYAEQQSAAITLTAGQRYWIEALQKEGGGGDSLAVAWEGPGFSRQVIPGAHLSPAPASGSWSTGAIGAPALAGSATQNGGTWTVQGGGNDIWNNDDQFHFVHQPFAGDGEITVRVASQTNTDPWAKAGVMIRDGLAGNARHAMVAVTPGNGVAFQRRTTTGGSSAHTAGTRASAPVWLRLTRVGSLISGYESADGVTWRLVGSQTLSLGTDVRIGLCVTSHNPGALSTAVFEHLVVTSAPGGAG